MSDQKQINSVVRRHRSTSNTVNQPTKPTPGGDSSNQSPATSQKLPPFDRNQSRNNDPINKDAYYYIAETQLEVDDQKSNDCLANAPISFFDIPMVCENIKNLHLEVKPLEIFKPQNMMLQYFYEIINIFDQGKIESKNEICEKYNNDMIKLQNEFKSQESKESSIMNPDQTLSLTNTQLEKEGLLPKLTVTVPGKKGNFIGLGSTKDVKEMKHTELGEKFKELLNVVISECAKGVTDDNIKSLAKAIGNLGINCYI